MTAALGRRVMRQLVRVLTTSVICRQRQYITIKVLDTSRPTAMPASLDGRTECMMLDSTAALDAVATEIGASFRDSVADLRARIARGCVVCVARRPRPEGGHRQVIGYEIAERGVFSALGRRIPVSDDVVFSHYVEVLPAFRGQRTHHLLFATRDEYFRQRNGRVVCGVCAPHNRASLLALRRDGAIIAGTVERVLLLRAFVAWYTPFERIAPLLG